MDRIEDGDVMDRKFCTGWSSSFSTDAKMSIMMEKKWCLKMRKLLRELRLLSDKMDNIKTKNLLNFRGI